MPFRLICGVTGEEGWVVGRAADICVGRRGRTAVATRPAPALRGTAAPQRGDVGVRCGGGAEDGPGGRAGPPRAADARGGRSGASPAGDRLAGQAVRDDVGGIGGRRGPWAWRRLRLGPGCDGVAAVIAWRARRPASGRSPLGSWPSSVPGHLAGTGRVPDERRVGVPGSASRRSKRGRGVDRHRERVRDGGRLDRARLGSRATTCGWRVTGHGRGRGCHGGRGGGDELPAGLRRYAVKTWYSRRRRGSRSDR